MPYAGIIYPGRKKPAACLAPVAETIISEMQTDAWPRRHRSAEVTSLHTEMLKDRLSARVAAIILASPLRRLWGDNGVAVPSPSLPAR